MAEQPDTSPDGAADAGTDGTDTRALRAVAHPVRLRMLSLLTPVAMSAAEVARELDLTHANASYHLRQLHEAGLLTVEGEERIRGGVAKRYRHVWDAPQPRVPSDESYVRTYAQELVRRYGQRAPGPRLLSDAELWVEPDTWARVVGLLTEAAHLLHAEARAPRSEGTVPVALTLAAFRLAEDAEQ